MPNYDYVCHACGRETEIFQRISDPPLTSCPACGKDALERLVSRSSFALRGSGWYADGYGAGAKGDGKKSEPPASSETKKSEPPPSKGEDKKSSG